jgi:hypothetical protein
MNDRRPYSLVQIRGTPFLVVERSLRGRLSDAARVSTPPSSAKVTELT